ncbi:DUF7268 family protein [Halorubrum sp. N11]|uniref:DUF7268 family protein n=1 Tax=Halorubrum sp. N11 TaxID=3402276 RepID=UPI003EB95AB1
MSLAPVVRERGRLVAGGVAVGAVTSPVLVAGLVAVGGFGPLAAAEAAFAFGGLWFGLGLLGWAGSVASGRAIEAAQEHLDTGTGWTERRSRRAMARVGGFGGGTMVSAAAVGTILV